MAKVNNPNDLNVKDLKKQADEQGITYNKNASAKQMQELLNPVDKTDNNESIKTSEKSEPNTSEKTKETDLGSGALLKRIQELENLVRKTGDHNKIKGYEDSLKRLDNFSFSIKLFPTEDGDFPVISWRTLKNYTARNKDDNDNQKIEITYLLKDGEKKTQEMDLVDFVRVLQRSDPIFAKSINNLDGGEVYVEEKMNKEEDLPFYIMRPKGDTFNVTLVYNEQEMIILSTYLNA